MKKILFILLVLLTVSINSQNKIDRNLGDFTVVKVYNGIEVELIQSTEQKIEITGQKADKVVAKNDGTTLKIYLEFPETLAKNQVLVKVYFNKDIQVIDANEGATITAKDFNQNNIDVKSQEGAFINMVINTKYLKIKASSGGIIKLSGSAKNQEVDVDLAGVYHGYNMVVSTLSDVKAGSGAKAEIKASETCDFKVTFGGSIFYKGNPEVLKTKKVIGGIIEHRE